MTSSLDLDTFILNADIPADRTLSLCNAMVDAMDAWGIAEGTEFSGAEAVDAIAMNFCAVVRQAPDDVIRAELTTRGLAWILRNCGAEPDLVKAFAALQGIGGVS